MNPRMKHLRSIDGLLLKDLPKAVRNLGLPVEDSTFRKWNNSVNPPSWDEFKDLEVSSIKKRDVWDYIDDESERISRNTVKTRVGYIGGLWQRLIERELIEVNPWARACSGQAWKFSIKQYPYREWSFYRQYHKDPLFLLLYFHGFRVGEIAGIMPEDVCVDKELKIPHFNLVHYKKPLRRLKNDMSIRQVPVHPALLKDVRKWKDKDLFPISTDRKGPGNSWSENFHKKLGLPDGEAAHSLRHNFLTRMNATLVNPKYISRLVGHNPQNMTEKYGGTIPDVLFEAICAIKDPR